MITLQIRICAGPDTGKRLRLHQPTITFGRADACDLTLDLPFISREHGRLEYADGAWRLVNLSPNGTRLGSRNVTTRPRPLKKLPVTLSIGDTLAFEILPPPEPPEAPGSSPRATDMGCEPVPGSFPRAADTGGVASATDTPGGTGTASPQTASGLTGRSKVWIGIGIYLAVSLVALAIIASFVGDDGPAGLPQVPRLTHDQIAEAIRTPPDKRPPDSRRVQDHLQQALQWFNQRHSVKPALFRCLTHYQQALAYTPGDQLPDPEDARRYQIARQELTDTVTEQYAEACDLLRNRSYDRAAEGFKTLLAIYPDPGSQLFKNSQRQWDIAKARLAQQ